jgi:toxin ParE1/3/4
MPRIFLHDQAKADLEEIADYIARDNFMAAQLIFPAVWEATVQLARMPGMGRAREFENQELAGVRSWVIRGYENYLIFYRPVPGGISVLRIVHGARDLEQIFGSERR